MQTSALVRRLSIATLLITSGHLLFGNIVSGTESGMGCGPHWPLCQGQLLPPLSDPALVIEWTHRLVALLVGSSIVATTLAVWRRARHLLGLAVTALVLVIIVGVFGGVTVLFDLPTALSTAHFALGTLLFAVLVVLATRTSVPRVQSAPVGVSHWALASAIVIYLQAVLGAYVRHSEAGMALPIWPFLTFFPNLAISPIAHQWVHRLMALLVLGIVLLAAARAIQSGYKAFAVSSVVLVLVQIALGIWTVGSLLHPMVAMLHLAGALALLSTQLVLTVLTWPRSAEGRSRVPLGGDVL